MKAEPSKRVNAQRYIGIKMEEIDTSIRNFKCMCSHCPYKTHVVNNKNFKTIISCF